MGFLSRLSGFPLNRLAYLAVVIFYFIFRLFLLFFFELPFFLLLMKMGL